MIRTELERRVTQRRNLWRQMAQEAAALKEALAEPDADPAPALHAMRRREELTAQLAALGEPTDEEQSFPLLDDEIVALMEEVERLDQESARRLAQAMEGVNKELNDLRGGRQVASAYGDQRKELFARYMSKKL